MPPKDNDLYIEVIGGGDVGESIIIRLPDGRFGLVDCFSKQVDDPKKNEIVMRLRAFGAEALEFVVLTHPHTDHFQGMLQVLQEITVRQFWYFNGSTRMIESMLLYLEAEARAGSTAISLQQFNELCDILALVGKRRREGVLRIERLTGIQQLMAPDPASDAETGVTITSIAPDATIVSAYEDKVVERCRTNPPDTTKRDVHQNELSAAIIIEFGQTRVLLSGDVEENTWKAILDRQEANYVNLTGFSFIKVSHHGSTNGYCTGLWDLFSQKNRSLAGLTPFKKLLPASEAVNHIAKHTRAIVATGIPSQRVDDFIRLSAGTLPIVVEATKSVAKSATPRSHTGSFNLSFSYAGHISGPFLSLSAHVLAGAM